MNFTWIGFYIIEGCTLGNDFVLTCNIKDKYMYIKYTPLWEIYCQYRPSDIDHNTKEIPVVQTVNGDLILNTLTYMAEHVFILSVKFPMLSNMFLVCFK